MINKKTLADTVIVIEMDQYTLIRFSAGPTVRRIDLRTHVSEEWGRGYNHYADMFY